MSPSVGTEQQGRDGITRMSVLLCFCVVLIHLGHTPLAGLSASHPGFVAAFAVNKLLSFAVPAFLFLSGHKLFARYGNAPLSIGRFYLGRLKKIVLPYLCAVAVYFMYFYAKGWVLLADLPEYILLGTLAAHFYYIVIAVQLYLLFPLLRLCVARRPYLALGVSFLVTLLLQQTNPFAYADRFFGSYLFYFILGAVFARDHWVEKGIPLARGAAALCLPVGAIHAWLSYRQTVGGIGYSLYGTVNFIYATLATVAVFGICIRSVARAPRLSLSRPVAAGSYGIYLYHLMVIFVLQYDVLPHFTSNVGLCYLCLALGVSGGILIYICLKERLLRYKSREKA